MDGFSVELHEWCDGLREADDNTNHAALPDDALKFLDRVCVSRRAKRVVEFGSGRSTRTFLEHGLAVTSVEDSHAWMQQTLKSLSDGCLANHSALVSPLRLRWLHGYPVMDWRLSDQVKAKIDEADLVLIDSPYYPGFRESTLMQVLALNPKLILLDDIRIETMKRICNRIRSQSRGLEIRVAPVGHRIAVLEKSSGASVVNRVGLYEWIRGWRRFLIYLMQPRLPSPV